MRLSLVVAAAENNVIGRDGMLPWRLPADLRHFKDLTMGHHLVMGRRTFESIGRPLPGRTNIVLSRRGASLPPGCIKARSLDEALEHARRAGESEVFVIGGGELYREALPRADRVYLTRVRARLEGDTYFPCLDPGCWQLVECRLFEADERNPHAYEYRTLDRRPQEGAT